LGDLLLPASSELIMIQFRKFMAILAFEIHAIYDEKIQKPYYFNNPKKINNIW
jgi:hypothetical protein